MEAAGGGGRERLALGRIVEAAGLLLVPKVSQGRVGRVRRRVSGQAGIPSRSGEMEWRRSERARNRKEEAELRAG